MHDPLLPVLAAGSLLLLASLLVPLARRIRLPLTVLLTLFGAALGFLVVAVPDGSQLGPAGDLLRGITSLGLEPEVFLAVFLPPLLFAAGLVIDVRRLVEEAWAVLLLAVVAVLVATAVIGVGVHVGVGMSLTAALLLGAIIATTDPAAVVSIFRDLGAPPRLTTLVQGESLLNDAAAIALFALLAGLLAGDRAPDGSSMVAQFAFSFAGGAILGLVMARITLWLMSRLGGDTTSEATAAIALCYLSYTLAEVYGQVSGVVAVVFAALTVAAYGPLRLTRHNWRSLVETWTQIEFWASSLIFILAAMLAARLIAGFGVHEAVLVVFIAGLAILARVIVVYGLLPVLVRTGLIRPVDGRFRLVVTWGGLRGATTLVLALAVAQMPGVPTELREAVAGLAVGFVFFTLIVAAPTLRPLLRMLGLDRLDPVDAALRDRVLGLTHIETRQRMATAASLYGLDTVGLARASAALDVAKASVDTDCVAGLSDVDQIRVALLTLTSRERELYLRHFEELTVSRALLAELAQAADRLAERVRSEGVEAWQEFARERAQGGRRFRRALALHRRFGLRRPLETALEDRFESLWVERRVLRELREFNRAELRTLSGAAVHARLDTLLGERLQATASALGALEVQFPEYSRELAVEHLQRAALRMEAADFGELLEQHLITPAVFDHLQKEIGRRHARIRKRPALDLGLRLGDLMRRSTLFKELPADKSVKLGRLLRPRLVVPGEKVIAKGEKADGMYFIVSGAVEVTGNGPATILGPGSFFGELALIDRGARTADVRATAYSHLLYLDAGDFERLLEELGDLRERIHAEANLRRIPGRSVL